MYSYLPIWSHLNGLASNPSSLTTNKDPVIILYNCIETLLKLYIFSENTS